MAVATEATVVVTVSAVPMMTVVIVVMVVRVLVIRLAGRMTAVHFFSDVRAHAHDLT
jgi:hypothetical protein